MTDGRRTANVSVYPEIPKGIAVLNRGKMNHFDKKVNGHTLSQKRPVWGVY